jgi:hypothetical protein
LLACNIATKDADVTTLAAQLDLFRPPRMTRTKRPLTPERLVQIALGVWAASGPVSGTLGAKFFELLHLEIPDASIVRFHYGLKFGDTRAPGLIWKLVDQRTGEPCGVMRVFLAQDGTTVIGKKVLGRAWAASISRAPRPP